MKGTHMSDNEHTEPRTPKNALNGEKKFEFDAKALDRKYQNPALMDNFKVYFGKYKGKLFSEILKDYKYAEYIASLKDVKTNNLYLLQKYINFKMKQPKQKIPAWAK